MPRLTIDNREVEVPEGATVLEAARKLGIDVPALCAREGCTSSTSCLVCLVRVGEERRMVPSCATVVADGMQVESETEAVHQARRTALELLLSDHLGDCLGPCQFGCPAGMDIPTMLRQIAAGEWRKAVATVKRDIALPAVFGRICSAPCEKVCHRGSVDAAVSICLLKRFVADRDLSSDEPYVPACKASSGKRVAIIGGGPSGLSAAYYLAQLGHGCSLFEAKGSVGGRLLEETSEEQLPRGVLAAEVAVVARLGVVIETRRTIESQRDFEMLREDFNAVLIAVGEMGREQAADWGLRLGPRGIVVQPQTYQTEMSRVFAVGNAIRGKAIPIRSAADGKEAAVAIDQFLCGAPVVGMREPFSTRIGRLQEEDLPEFAQGCSPVGRKPPVAERSGYQSGEAVEQAGRCLQCDCRGLKTCKLRHYAEQYRANPRRYKADRRMFQRDARHAEVVYEPGKCIACGLCVQIVEAAGEPIGVTFLGRGFDVRVAVPLERSLAEGLTTTAAKCVEACPTAALAWKVRATEVEADCGRSGQGEAT